MLLAAGANTVAFVQAWAMTHFVDGVGQTVAPERLTRLGKLRVLLTGVRVPRPADTLTPADVGLPFTGRRVAGATADLAVWCVPAERHRAVVVLFHGYSASRSSLIPAAGPLHDLGCDLVLVDFRGSGGSAGRVTTIGYREADDVAAAAAFARTWRPGEPVVLLGQSMGAAAVLRAVGQLHVPAEGLLLESPYDRLLSTAENRFRSMGLPPFPAAELLVFWGGVQQGYWAFGLNPAEAAAGVRCPAVVLHGDLDPRVTVAQSRAVFDALGGPKHFERFATAGHLGFREADPGRWRRVVDVFLSTLGS